MAWAVAQKVERPADKLVLLGLADRHNTEYDCAYPSVAWLCDFSGLDRKTVNNAMNRLAACGLIRDSGKRVGPTKRVKAYELALVAPFEIGPKTDVLNRTENGPIEEGNRSVFPYQYVQKRTTKPIKEPVKDAIASSKRASLKKSEDDLPDWMPREAWSDYVSMRKAIKAPLTPKAKTLAIAKLDELARAGHPPGAVLEQSILNSWRGLFELKGNRNERNGSPIQRRRHPALDILAESGIEAADDDADYFSFSAALSPVRGRC